ncbi:MAG TPA: phage holin family protein [Chitinophagaceae bacterium]|nr:phage holin family protein [Chitinophagaceae bacterium]
MNFFIKILITAVNVFLLAMILPGVELIKDDFITAIIVALVLAFLDAIVKPLLILFTLPATILSLGLFLFVINACIILLAAYFVGGFKVDGFWYALLFSICLSLLNSFIHKKAFSDKSGGRHIQD